MLKKNQTSISQDIEEKILSKYAKGMTTGDILSPLSFQLLSGVYLQLGFKRGDDCRNSYSHYTGVRDV